MEGSCPAAKPEPLKSLKSHRSFEAHALEAPTCHWQIAPGDSNDSNSQLLSAAKCPEGPNMEEWPSASVCQKHLVQLQHKLGLHGKLDET